MCLSAKGSCPEKVSSAADSLSPAVGPVAAMRFPLSVCGAGRNVSGQGKGGRPKFTGPRPCVRDRPYAIPNEDHPQFNRLGAGHPATLIRERDMSTGGKAAVTRIGKSLPIFVFPAAAPPAAAGAPLHGAPGEGEVRAVRRRPLPHNRPRRCFDESSSRARSPGIARFSFHSDSDRGHRCRRGERSTAVFGNRQGPRGKHRSGACRGRLDTSSRGLVVWI